MQIRLLDPSQQRQPLYKDQFSQALKVVVTEGGMTVHYSAILALELPLDLLLYTASETENVGTTVLKLIAVTLIWLCLVC